MRFQSDFSFSRISKYEITLRKVYNRQASIHMVYRIWPFRRHVCRRRRGAIAVAGSTVVVGGSGIGSVKQPWWTTHRGPGPIEWLGVFDGDRATLDAATDRFRHDRADAAMIRSHARRRDETMMMTRIIRYSRSRCTFGHRDRLLWIGEIGNRFKTEEHFGLDNFFLIGFWKNVNLIFTEYRVVKRRRCRNTKKSIDQ